MKSSALLTIALSSIATAIWPIPTNYTSGSSVLWIDGSVGVNYTCDGQDSTTFSTSDSHKLKQKQPDPANFTKPSTPIDESYTLSVPTSGDVVICPNLRAGGTYTKLAPVEITDAPKFQHRGLNMDTARNYFKVEDIKKTLDAWHSPK
ncbi:hypothetical protein MRB53_040679 [Persea americana]|nr:hypothetical protein MRB53_040679 [Persea americana]